MQRTVLLVLALMLIGLLGWAGGAQEGAKEVNLLHYGHTQPPFDGLIARNIDNFMAGHPNIKVEYVTFADPDLQEKVLTAVAGGQAPDSFTIAASRAAVFLEKDLCVTIDPAGFGKNTVEEVVNLWQSGALKAAGGFFKGKYYGIPHELSNYCAWLNMDHFREAGLDPEKDAPKTWDDFAAVAKKLTVDEGGVRKRNGFGVNFKTPGFVMNVSYPLLYGKGVGLVNDAVTKGLLDQPGAEQAVTTFTGWILKDKIWDPGLVTDDREGFGNELLSMFLTGGAWYWGVMKSEYPDTYDKAKVFPYPRYKGGKDFGGIGYGYSTYVTKASKQQKEAWMMADAIASTPDDFIKEGLFQPRIGYSEQVAKDNLPSWDVFGAELKHASPRPLTQYYEELIAIYFKAVSEIVYEGKAVKAALGEANGKINGVLSQ